MNKVAIPEKMEKYYGEGIMLHPDREMVETLMFQIPAGKVATIDALCAKLAWDHDTDVTCPLRTGNFVKEVMEQSQAGKTDVPYWRVIRKNLRLINSPFVESCAEKLDKEGVAVHRNNKGEFQVSGVKDRLFTFL